MLRTTEREALRKEAAAWFARMMGPDAEPSRFAFEAWRRADPAHAAAYRSIEQSWRDAALLSFTDLGKNRSLDSVRVPFHGRPLWQKVAAYFFIVSVGLGLTLFAWCTPKSATQSQFANAIGSPRVMRLDDGTIVTLDTDTAITASLGGPERFIRILHGRIRFDVAHDPSHPFVVDAGAGEVVARGTLFDVDMTQRNLKVTLYRGAVDVRLHAKHGRTETTRHLAPGQRIVQSDRGDGLAIVAAPAGENHWVSGMLSFNAASLGEVATQANRYSTRHIEVDPAVANFKVTGTFSKGDNETIARALASTFNLDIQQQADANWKLGPTRSRRDNKHEIEKRQT